MNTKTSKKNQKPVAIILVVLISLGSTLVEAKEKTGYAEALYRDFADFSESDITFDINYSEKKPLSELAGAKIGTLLPVPNFKIEFEEGPISLRGTRFVEIQGGADVSEDYEIRLSQFEEIGYPVYNGTYRLLGIKTTIEKESRNHDAIELCWESQHHCVVVDSAADYINSTINEKRKLRAEGWSEKITYDRPEGAAKASVCTIQGHGSNRSITHAKPSYPVRKETTLGVLLYKGSIGATTAQVACSTNFFGGCTASATSQADGSTGSAYHGYGVTCPNPKTHRATDGGTGDVAYATGCAWGTRTIAYALGFKLSGSGVNANIVLDPNQGVRVATNAVNAKHTCLVTSTN